MPLTMGHMPTRDLKFKPLAASRGLLVFVQDVHGGVMCDIVLQLHLCY